MISLHKCGIYPDVEVFVVNLRTLGPAGRLREVKRAMIRRHACQQQLPSSRSGGTNLSPGPRRSPYLPGEFLMSRFVFTMLVEPHARYRPFSVEEASCKTGSFSKDDKDSVEGLPHE
jgi:hypothetical protein